MREAYVAAVDAFDLRRARRLVMDAAADGASLGRLYVDVVRPALQLSGAGRLAGDAPAEDRVMLESVEAALAVVASRPVQVAAMRGQGRHALVSVGAAPLDALDGQVIVDVLCGDGWAVTEIAAGADAERVTESATEHHAQLVVMPTSNAADLLVSAATYTLLRRMADPPLIVACSFGRPEETRRARTAGADALVSDPDELLAFVDRRLPPGGSRNWGVRLRRLGDTLVLAPTGDLDAGSVHRLRAVADSRLGSFRALVIDTRDVASVSTDGAGLLVGWLRAAAADGHAHRVLPGSLFDGALAGAAVEDALVAAPADAGP